MKKKSYEQELLYKGAKKITEILPPHTEYSFNDVKNIVTKILKLNGVSVSVNDQREAGRRYSIWVKKFPGANVIIIGCKSNGNLIYRKTGSNPYNNSNTSKGGVR
ncbi:hypothetical protein SHJJP8909_001211 [Staphylococcus lugdunensis]|uniref:cassette chromosome ssDNA-binding protein n=1 Tax=Staphylococcus TaxID=1279 RepID=UPI001F4D0781|nr:MULTISPECIES: hypothetical protein [Staphylococcus]MCH8675438.1 hypothetical protein [Staphylococcus lugdunensis]MDS3910539.1 hypothetical protein [Staphylococcus hominis]HEH2158519.1 hypothetical protein [Staphylococcus aureus]